MNRKNLVVDSTANEIVGTVDLDKKSGVFSGP